MNYKSLDYLQKCLKSVIADLEQSELTWVVSLLDNGSGDNLNLLGGRHSSGFVDTYHVETNLGFGGGNNFLSHWSRESKYTLILNPDTEFIEPDTVKRLVAALRERPQAAAVGPQLIKEGKVQAWDHGEVTGLMGRLAQMVGGSWYLERHQATEVAWVSGAVLLIRSEVFEALSGFDESFFLYKEEEDLLLRARKLGYEVWYVPSVRVYHSGGGSGARKDKHMAPSLRHFSRKHRRWYNPLPKIWVPIQCRFHLFE